MLSRLYKAWKKPPDSALSFFILAMILNLIVWIVVLYALYNVIV